MIEGIEMQNHRTERHHLFWLLDRLSATALPQQKEAAKELRFLTKNTPSFRSLFGEYVEAIPRLLAPLSGVLHTDLQEDLITTLLNLSIHESNKKIVAETPMVIPLLMEALRYGTIQTRSNAAAAIFTLSALQSNKARHPLAMKDVASAIFNLCILHEDKARAVRNGAVWVILNKIMDGAVWVILNKIMDGAVWVILYKIMDGVLVNELLAILAMLSAHQTAVVEIGELGAVHCLLPIVQESNCEKNRENCIAMLHTVCLNDRTKWKAIKEEENTHGTISKLAQYGTSRTKRKANAILDRLRKFVNITHTA